MSDHSLRAVCSSVPEAGAKSVGQAVLQGRVPVPPCVPVQKGSETWAPVPSNPVILAIQQMLHASLHLYMTACLQELVPKVQYSSFAFTFSFSHLRLHNSLPGGCHLYWTVCQLMQILQDGVPREDSFPR